MTTRDDELETIRGLWRQLSALPTPWGDRHIPTPAYLALIQQIRAVVDARTAKRGTEWVIVAEGCSGSRW